MAQSAGGTVMKLSVRHAGVFVVTLAVIAAAAACDSTTSPPGTPATSQGAPNPNAPDTNPAGDIPDNQAYVPYTPAGQDFTVSAPEGWARTISGTATTFMNKFNSVRIDAARMPAAPTIASATADELPGIRSTTNGFSPGSVSTVSRKAGQAVLITYHATSVPDAVTAKTVAQDVERYEFWRNGEEVILTLTAPAGADNVDPWHTITDSLRWQG
jgi:hypothetical protein